MATSADIQLSLATPDGSVLSLPKSATGAAVLPDNYILVAAEVTIDEAIEQVTFNGKNAFEVEGKYELIEFFPEGVSTLEVVVVTKTGVTYVSTFEFIAPEDKGIKGVLADWIGDTGVGDRFYPTCEGILYVEDDDTPFSMAMQGGYTLSVNGDAAMPVGDGWYVVTDIGDVSITCTTVAGPFEDQASFTTTAGRAAHVEATSGGLTSIVVTAGEPFAVDCGYTDADGRATSGDASIHVRPSRRGIQVDGNTVTLSAAGSYRAVCAGSGALTTDALHVEVEPDASSATAHTSSNTSGWTMTGVEVRPQLSVLDRFGNALATPDELRWSVVDEDGNVVEVDDSPTGDAPASGEGLGTPNPGFWFWEAGRFEMIPYIPGLGDPLPGDPPAVEIDVDGRFPGEGREFRSGFPNCFLPTDTILREMPADGVQRIQHRINGYEELADVVLKVNGEEVPDDEFEVEWLEGAEIPIYEVTSDVEGRLGVNFVEVEYRHHRNLDNPDSALRWSRFVCTFQFAEAIRPFGEAASPQRANVAAVLEADVFDETPTSTAYAVEEEFDNLASVVNAYLASEPGEQALELAIEESDRRVKRANLVNPRVSFQLVGNTLRAQLHVERVTVDIGKPNKSKRQYTARIRDVEYEFVATVTQYAGAPFVVIHSANWTDRGSMDIDAQRAGAWIVQAFRSNASEREQMEAHLHDAASELQTYLQGLVLDPFSDIWTARTAGETSATFEGAVEVPAIGSLIGAAMGSSDDPGRLDLSFDLARAELAADIDRSGFTTRLELDAYAAADPVGFTSSDGVPLIPGPPQFVDLSQFGESGDQRVQAQVRWDIVNELIYAYWATGGLDGFVIGTDRLGDSGALAGLPDCVQFEVSTTAPPTLVGAGTGRVRAEFPGITLLASVGLDATGACDGIVSFLPLWVRLGLVAELEVSALDGPVVSIDALEITEFYVTADDWDNLMLALALSGAVDIQDNRATELGAVDQGMEGLIAELLDALLGALPLQATLPSVPLGDELSDSLGSMLPGASELAVTELELQSPRGAMVDVDAAGRSRVAIGATLELR